MAYLTSSINVRFNLPLNTLENRFLTQFLLRCARFVSIELWKVKETNVLLVGGLTTPTTTFMFKSKPKSMLLASCFWWAFRETWAKWFSMRTSVCLCMFDVFWLQTLPMCRNGCMVIYLNGFAIFIDPVLVDHLQKESQKRGEISRRTQTTERPSLTSESSSEIWSMSPICH